MRITVFTPTYNRGYIVDRLYRSLQRQSFHDFEWIVVDDGSTDNTEELFAGYLKEDNFFPIRYVKTENGGKHRAINKGVSLAEGELFFIVDSDDYLADDALETIDRIEHTIPNELKSYFCGVCGQKGYINGNHLGKTFDGDTLDLTMLEREKIIFPEIKQRYFTPPYCCNTLFRNSREKNLLPNVLCGIRLLLTDIRCVSLIKLFICVSICRMA